MRFVPNQRYDVGNNIGYIIKSDHRDSTQGKSQWHVPADIEANIFSNAYKAAWVINGDTGWGLYRPANAVSYLGVDKTHKINAFIAKFVRDPNAPDWHGYPVIHTLSTQDVPDSSILGAWQAAKILSGAQVRKIMRMQPCKL